MPGPARASWASAVAVAVVAALTVWVVMAVLAEVSLVLPV